MEKAFTEKIVKLDRYFLIPKVVLSPFLQAASLKLPEVTNKFILLLQLSGNHEEISCTRYPQLLPNQGSLKVSKCLVMFQKINGFVITTLNLLDFCTVNVNNNISPSPELVSSTSSNLDWLLEHTNKTMVTQL